MLAITGMSATATAIFYAVAFVAFVFVAILAALDGFEQRVDPVFWLGVGLAAWVFVAFWNALALT